MTDFQPAIDEAAKVGATVTSQAAAGNTSSFALVAVVAVFMLLGLLIWRLTGRPTAPPAEPPPERPRHDNDCDPPADGCPAIRLLVDRLDGLTSQIADDRVERRDHRREVREDVNRIHERLDEMPKLFAGKDAVSALIQAFNHHAEEASRLLTEVNRNHHAAE